MKICYHLSEYISHRRAGEAYMACLRDLGHTLVDDPAGSDLVILHEAPHFYPEIFRNMPRRPGVKYVGYAVWETPELPFFYKEGVKLVDAVWTCSEFSRRAFLPYVPAFRLPHVVERPKVSREDMLWMAERLGMREIRREAREEFYFYTIVDTVNPRKNVKTLLAAFAAAFPPLSGRGAGVKLVIKQYREPRDLSLYRGVIDVPEFLDDGKIAALHAVCDAYVSAHHAEAWGLPLSEALSFGNPVIATGYSGNMEFMNPKNSFPVPYTPGQVSREMCLALPALFSPEMTWANIDAPGLVQAMRRARSRPATSDFRVRAAASVSAFSPEAVRERLSALLAAL